MALRFSTRLVPMRSVEEVIESATAVRAIHNGITVVHDGAVALVKAEGPARLASIRERLPQFEHDGPGPGPLWLGGASFDAPWPGFPAAAFWLPKTQWLWTSEGLLETTCDAPVVPPAPSASLVLSPTTREQWTAGVEAARAAIQDGHVAKVVLARAASAPPGNPRAAFLQLKSGEGTTFLFEHGATFFGSTPECLVRINESGVATHALAGTAARESAAELSVSPKDVLEHELVVAFVRERLVEAGVKNVRQAPRAPLAWRHLAHLETPICGETDSHILDVASFLQPTPAVCGTPRSRSMELIRQLESFDRGWYAGAVGWFDAKGHGELAVALRCGIDDGVQRLLFAGAGIVAGSDPDLEWDETESKLGSMREAP